MSANGKEKIIEYLKSNILVTDGAMGTYFASLYDTKKYMIYTDSILKMVLRL